MWHVLIFLALAFPVHYNKLKQKIYKKCNYHWCISYGYQAGHYFIKLNYNSLHWSEAAKQLGSKTQIY